MKLKSPSELEERGFSSIVSLGVAVIVLLIAASIFVSSLRSYQSKTRAAERDRDERITKSTQTDVKIENAWYYSTGENLEVKSINTGSTILEVSEVQIFLDGAMVSEDDIRSKLVNGVQTDIWAPTENLDVEIRNQNEEPQKIKLIVNYGISDYFTQIENR